MADRCFALACVVAFADLVALASCWRDAAPPARPPARPGAAPPGSCPLAIAFSLSSEPLWSHELFAGCAPPPFTVNGIVCGASCPTPCSERMTWDAAVATMTYAYADGRLVAATTQWTGKPPDDPPIWNADTRCSYDHGALVRCTTTRGVVEVRRDARGRIVEVRDPEASLEVSYDERGDASGLVVRRGDSTYATTLVYDAEHRITRETGTCCGDPKTSNATVPVGYAYDARGRLARVDLADSRYRYDSATGLLAAIIDRDTTTSFAYDPLRRPIRITSPSSTPRVPATESTFSYDCPAK